MQSLCLYLLEVIDEGLQNIPIAMCSSKFSVLLQLLFRLRVGNKFGPGSHRRAVVELIRNVRGMPGMRYITYHQIIHFIIIIIHIVLRIKNEKQALNVWSIYCLYHFAADSGGTVLITIPVASSNPPQIFDLPHIFIHNLWFGLTPFSK